MELIATILCAIIVGPIILGFIMAFTWDLLDKLFMQESERMHVTRELICMIGDAIVRK